MIGRGINASPKGKRYKRLTMKAVNSEQYLVNGKNTFDYSLFTNDHSLFYPASRLCLSLV